MPLTNSSISKYEAKVESLLNDVELEKKRLLEDAQKDADNIKTRANLIVQEAEANASKIIEDAKKEAENIINKASLDKENISAQTKEIEKQAYEAGFQKGQADGLEKFKQDSISSIKSLETLVSSSFDLKQNIIKSADIDIIDLVIAIARKITTKSFDENMLREITISAISQLKNKEEITIIVNPSLVNNISNLSESFKEEIAQLKNLKIIEDSSLSSDGVIVESPLSRVDGRISSQIDEIASRLINGITDDVQQE